MPLRGDACVITGAGRIRRCAALFRPFFTTRPPAMAWGWISVGLVERYYGCIQGASRVTRRRQLAPFSNPFASGRLSEVD
jgi:hypothetical protein